MLRGQRVRALREFCFALCLLCGFQAALAAERVGSECPPYGNTGTDAAWTTGARPAGILFRVMFLRGFQAALAEERVGSECPPYGNAGRMLRGQRVRALREFCFALCLLCGFPAALAAERVGSECPPYGNAGTDAAWTTGVRPAGILFRVMFARLSGCLRPYHSSQCRFLRVWKVQRSVCCRPSWLYRNSAVYSVS